MLTFLPYVLAGFFYTASPPAGGDVSQGPARQNLHFGGYTGWGWDDNIFWSLTEDPGYLLPPGLAKDRLPPIVSDQFFFLSPFLSYGIMPTHRQTVRLRWTGAFRHYLQEKWSLINMGAVNYDIRIFQKLFAEMEIEAISNDRGKFNEQRFRSGRSKITFSWREHGTYSVRGGYFFRAVYFPDPAREENEKKKLNLEHGAEIGIRVHPLDLLSFDSAYKYASTKSSIDFQDHESHRFHVAGSATLPFRLKLSVSCGVIANLFPRFHLQGGGTPGPRRDLLLWYGGTVEWTLFDWFSLWAHGSFEHLQIGFSEETSYYRRFQLMGGVQIKWEKTWARKGKRGEEIRPLDWSPSNGAPSSDQPEKKKREHCKGRWVTFRFNAESAREVSLIGDFNDWNERENIMTRRGKIWSVTVCLKEGRHLYTYKVDGQVLKKPPAAETTVPDGFGGYNGVVIIDSEGE